VYSSRKGSDGESARMRTRGFERSRGREKRRDSDVRGLVERSPISPGQRWRWNSSNRRISYYQCRWTFNTHDHQHWRCVGITASSSQMQRRDQPARIARRVSSAAARPNGTGRCARGQEDRAARAWVEGSERAELGTGEGEWNGKGRRRDGRRGGGEGRYLWSSRKAAGLSRTRLPRSGGR
jgi:hypothetical protein